MADFTFLVPQNIAAQFPGLPADRQLYISAFDDNSARAQLASAYARAEVPNASEVAQETSGGLQDRRIGTSLQFAEMEPMAGGAGGFGGGGSILGAGLQGLGRGMGFVGGDPTAEDIISTAGRMEHERLLESPTMTADQRTLQSLPQYNPTLDLVYGDIYGDYQQDQLDEGRQFADEDANKRLLAAEQKAKQVADEQFKAAGEAIKTSQADMEKMFEDSNKKWAAKYEGTPTGESIDNLNAITGPDAESRGEAIEVQDLIENPGQYLTGLPEEQRDMVFIDDAGTAQLNPWLFNAMALASQQAGYVSAEQVQLIQSAALKEIATINRDSALEIAKAEGASREAVATIETDANTEIARLDRNLRENEFYYQDRKNTLEFNLQQRMQENEYNLLVRQGERSENAAARQHAAVMSQNRYQFELQQADTAAEREAVGLRFQQEQERLEAEERERIRAAEARATQQERQIFLQMEQDRITAETNQNIAVIQADVGLDANAKQAAIAREQIAADQELAELQQTTAFGVEQTRLSAVEEQAGAEKAAAESARLGQIGAAEAAAAAASPFGFLAQEGLTPEQLSARETQIQNIQQQQFNPYDLSTAQFQQLQALQAGAAGPFGYVAAGADPVDRAQRLTDAQTILGEQYNPYALTGTQFTDMQGLQARAGATPFGALATAPDARYQNILDLQEAQAAQGPFQAAQLGMGMENVGTILRGGLTPEQQLALARAPGNPFGLTATEQMALQNSLARGGLTPTQRLAEVQAGAAPQNMANYLNFIGNPAAVGFAGQSGFLQNVADSPEGNIPAALFGLNVPQNAPTVPVNPTLANLTDLTDEQLGFYQGQMAAQNYQTPSQIYQQAQTVTPQGV